MSKMEKVKFTGPQTIYLRRAEPYIQQESGKLVTHYEVNIGAGCTLTTWQPVREWPLFIRLFIYLINLLIK